MLFISSYHRVARTFFFPLPSCPTRHKRPPAEKTKLGLEPQVIEAGQILSFDNRGRLGKTKKQKKGPDQRDRLKSLLQFLHGIHSERAVGVENTKKRLRNPQIPIKESEIYLLVVIWMIKLCSKSKRCHASRNIFDRKPKMDSTAYGLWWFLKRW